MAKQNLKMAQKKKNKKMYDRKVERREYCAGDQVLVLQPLINSPFQAKFFGPCNVVRRVSEQKYMVETPNKKKSVKVCHVNSLKPYFACGDTLVSDRLVLVAGTGPEEEMYDKVVLQPRLKNSESLAKLDSLLEHLDETKRKQLIEIIQAYPDLFSDTPYMHQLNRA